MPAPKRTPVTNLAKPRNEDHQNGDDQDARDKDALEPLRALIPHDILTPRTDRVNIIVC